MKNISYFLILPLSFLSLINSVSAEIKRVKFSQNNQDLIIEVLDDDLIHFELSAQEKSSPIDFPLQTSPMIARKNYSGASTYSRNQNVIATKEIYIQVNPTNLCISLTDKVKKAALTTICPQDLQQDWKSLTLTPEKIENIYGLGQQFKQLGSADGDWLSHGVRAEQPQGQEQAHGNGFMPFGSAGMVGNVQFPIMYAVGKNNLNYALFLDNPYKQRWDFSSTPWKVQMWGDQIRFYVMTGKDLPNLRQDYLELVGKPPVPPKKAFGLWVSEFGYKNWNQVKTIRDGLRKDKFPVDGFVLDLQWFGGIIPNSPDSRMGALDWDEKSNDGNDFEFPNPGKEISDFLADGIGLVAIEESYINKNTSTYAAMKAANMLAYSKTNNQCDATKQSNPVILKNWFGEGGMVDWSDRAAGEWVHNNRRFPNLVQKGILGHWTDLGEPEKYDGNACYEGIEVTAGKRKNQHGDIHNLYNLFWNQSIYEGYFRDRQKINRRPFIVTRSGAPGIQRYGAAMWSGDIGSNLELLVTHLNSQMHMSFSGIDYYGSDIGGFRREGVPYNENHSGNLQYEAEMYTQWFANGAWFDVPIRPHTDNSFQTDKRYETSPNLVGDKQINLANLRQRYELTPYYYSLAYRAFLQAEPVIAPLVFYFQNDPQVRNIGHQKLIGKDILVGVVAKHGESDRDIYLPQGKWINYHTNQWLNSSGDWLKSFPTYINGILRLPTFVRSGAIIPLMYVDADTKNVFGDRLNKTQRNELILKVYPDEKQNQFTLYEDDGETISYSKNKEARYQTRITKIKNQKLENIATVKIEKSIGTYKNAIQQRNNFIQLIVENAKATTVTMNGTKLTQFNSQAEFEAAASGWYNAGENLILAKSGVQNTQQEKKFEFNLASIPVTTSINFVCDNAWTNAGESIHVVGNQPQLGNWDINKAQTLSANINYAYIHNPPPNHNGPGTKTPKWTGLISGLSTNTSIEWKCVKKLASGKWQWQTGDNNRIQSKNITYSGSSQGKL
ncbi:TIM-barrel domain-containing protein [Calothrix sp. UHCC 0171]|uniref:TIM-barrel domain-containing protein n=1 Tax=Calothrix sp. UHCC 0171 TaxID=3110245 RepID=UPI002B1FF170|nr:TIM-barrel domain-containing protein [Calothrix sp. UHCC 0171]MEA5571957.1 TIM-barrel domain-containing protein [Calothrix sp. UHCC 0171]